MSGVTVGTRLEQLLKLRDRIEQEIAAERVRSAVHPKRRVPFKPERPRRTHVNAVDLRLEDLGVTSRHVKEWAFDARLIDRIPRGRVGADLVEKYAAARVRLNDLMSNVS